MSDQNNIDQQLIERIQRGDKNAFNLLVKKYQHKVVSLVSRYVNNPGDVPDVAQEAFIKAYRAIPDFRGERPARVHSLGDSDRPGDARQAWAHPRERLGL